MKRITCLMLALMLVMGLMGVQVFAAEEETTQPTEVQTRDETQPQEQTVPEEDTQPDDTQPEDTEPTEPEDTGFVTSEECVNIIKQYEGFCKYPMWDYGQYTVGYGTRCPDDKLAEYRKNGITEEQAEALLREFLFNFEAELNERLIEKYGLTFTQHQFDAVLSFSYNCGTAWIYDKSGTMFNAITKGVTGNELVRSFALWCSAGGQVLPSLMNRRLAEANMYLNGVYNRVPPDNFRYVLYDANGGTTSPRTQGYDINYTVKPYPTPVFEGYNFEGWYTERIGGTKVTTLTAEHHTKTLYAHWVDDEGNSSIVQEGNVTVTVTATDVNVRKGPGTNYAKVGMVDKGDVLVITETAAAGGYNWGKFSSGWIALQYTDYDSSNDQDPEDDPEPTEPETEPTEPETEPTEPETTEPEVTEPEPTPPVTTKIYGTVQVQDYLNVRSGPGTGYSTVGKLNANARVEILEQKTVGSVTWGKISNGWVSMQYVKLDSSTTGGTTGSTGGNTATSVGTGTVVNCTQVNVRSGPGTNYSKIGYLDKGTKVTFTEFKMVGSVKWGKTEKGWISLDYVKLDETTTGGTTTSTVTGVADVDDFLRVRSGPGTSYAVSGYLKPNEKVTITEQKTVGNTTWGKISLGWVSMQYIKLDSTSGGTTDGNTTTGGNTGSTATTAVTGTINVQDSMNVRSGPGTTYAVVGTLKANEKVTITEQKKVGSVTWGKISTGWISMQYVKLDSTTGGTTGGNTTTGGTSTSVTGIANVQDSMNVRSGPGTNYAVVGKLKANQTVTITEIKTVSGVVWGKISAGWVSMQYIKIVETPAEDVRTVNATSLYVRSTPGTGSIVGYLYNGAKVTILEIKTVDGRQWGRITNGWICLEYTKK